MTASNSARRFARHIRTLPLIAASLALGTAGMTGIAHAQQAAPAQDAVAAQQTAQQPTGRTGWNFPIYDIEPDESVIYGMLDNGMKYAVLRNETPQNAASVRLAFDFGSIGEGEDELGLAHFLEHMAFNGSANIPEGEMIKILEREGLAFGADTNASTGFDKTEYKLDLPNTSPELVGTALMIMRETASNLTIDPDAVDRERGVLLSEMRTRDNFNLRRIKDYFQFAGPETPFYQRLPIGTAEVLNNASADTIRSLYNRYYRPENATLVMVGDFDPAMIEAQIKSRFADWRGVGEAGAPMERGRIDTLREPEAGIFVDPAVPNIVTIDRFAEYTKRPTTLRNYTEGLMLNLASRMMNRRFEKISNQDGSPLIQGVVDFSSFLMAADQASVTAVGKDGEWQAALQIAEQETRRAQQYGFTQAELTEQLANYEQAVTSQAEQAGTRRNAQLAAQIIGTLAEEDIFLKPQTQLELFQRLKPVMTVENINTVFANRIQGSEPLIHVSVKEDIPGGTDAVLAAYDASSKVAVMAPANEAAAEFAYDDFGTPGTVVSDTMIEDLGIRTIRFANNVMLNLKPTDFEQGKLRYSIEVGSGALALPQDQYGLPIYMSVAFANGGLGKHSSDELSAILAGRDVAPGLSVSTDYFGTSGSTKMADLERQMQVSAAFLTDPGYRPAMQQRWEAIVPLLVAQLDSSPQQVAGRDLNRILNNGDMRFGIPSQDVLLGLDATKLKAALTEQFANAPIEIAVVGEFDADEVIAAVAKTFGALPERRLTDPEFTEARTTSFPADRSPVTLYHSGTPDQALATATWPTTDDDDAREEAVMSMLGSVMRLELLEVVREKLGASYSPSASSSMSSIYDDYGVLTTSVIIAPDQADVVYDAVAEIARKLRDETVSDDLLERARKPLMERFEKDQRENSYWTAVASTAQSEADRLDRVRNRKERYASVTTADLQAAALKYLTPGGAKKVTVVHESLKPE
ncbi:putative zinc protease PqqL [Alteripontixanthobacter maritimus]|uniref:Putative zinc protease PqqL n=1 Tax=Alteripontixanthobacter maritimus TaxID=2161824 RepID=A0A369Q7A3_9SPHN|nr:insulinase family protein [Alteripontixanthobacter maritimus]RDC60743.1 putative zinc protease PqqL [Alteripontixanthobacter maritimus]